MTAIPAEAVSAAAEVLTNIILNGREATTGDELMDAAVAKLMLEAAAPLIAAAERERIRQLADTWMAQPEQDWGGEVTRECGRQLAVMLMPRDEP